MKIQILFLFFLCQMSVLAQKPCEYSINVTDSIGTLKETKSCLVYEKIFGNTSQWIFLSLISENGTPYVNLQVIQKSPDFLSPKCIDANSKIYFQLANGKIYTMVNSSPENRCDDLIYNTEEKVNNRFLNVRFLFRKDDFEEIKKYTITMMRVKYASETIDYILPKLLVPEKVQGIYEPEKFFIDSFPCLN